MKLRLRPRKFRAIEIALFPFMKPTTLGVHESGSSPKVQTRFKVEILREYLEARGRNEDAEQQLLEFLWDEFDEDRFAPGCPLDVGICRFFHVK